MQQKIIDTHFHIWDLKNNYPWLENMNDYGLNNNYFLNNFLDDAKKLNLSKSVHIQAEIIDQNKIFETEWLQKISNNHNSNFPNAIVGFVDLSSKNFISDIEKHCQYKNFRGIRQILKSTKDDESFLKNDIWINNLKYLEKYNLSFDLLIFFHQYKSATNVIKKYPNILFIINHCFWPQNSENDFNNWAKALKSISSFDNVVIKISGFGEWLKNCSLSNIKPYILETIDCFGLDRCMFGSNFPVDKQISNKTYEFFWNIYFETTKNFSDDEKNKMFFYNAEKYYRI